MSEQDTNVPQLIAAAQREYPNQRVTQIIFNALDSIGVARNTEGHPIDLFYIEDDKLIKALKTYIKSKRL